jgi:hypothetical protein
MTEQISDIFKFSLFLEAASQTDKSERADTYFTKVSWKINAELPQLEY